MIRALLRRFVRPRNIVVGTMPGYLWDTSWRRWIPAEQATSCRHGAYSEFGPVHTDTGLPA